MKKTIFEGTINGTKYDSVKSYNEAMNKLLAEGSNIEASSNTRIVEVSEECVETCSKKSGCDCEEGVCACNTTVDPIIMSKEDIEKMLNAITGDDDADQCMYDKFYEQLDNNDDEFLEQIEEMCDNKLNKIKDAIEIVSEELDGVIKANNDSIKNIREKIDELEEKQNILDTADEFLSCLKDHYEITKQNVTNELKKRNPRRYVTHDPLEALRKIFSF